MRLDSLEILKLSRSGHFDKNQLTFIVFGFNKRNSTNLELMWWKKLTRTLGFFIHSMSRSMIGLLSFFFNPANTSIGTRSMYNFNRANMDNCSHRCSAIRRWSITIMLSKDWIKFWTKKSHMSKLLTICQYFRRNS